MWGNFLATIIQQRIKIEALDKELSTFRSVDGKHSATYLVMNLSEEPTDSWIESFRSANSDWDILNFNKRKIEIDDIDIDIDHLQDYIEQVKAAFKKTNEKLDNAEKERIEKNQKEVEEKRILDEKINNIRF